MYINFLNVYLYLTSFNFPITIKYSIENNIVSIEKCNNEHDRYLCKNQRCIFLNATCNEKNDCGDNSDEDLDSCKKGK